MLMIVGSILLLVGAVFGIVVLVNAFKESVGQGLLCMFVPFYIFYYAFARYSSPKKGLVLAGWLGGMLLGGTLQGVGAAQAAADFVDATEEANAKWEQQLEADLAAELENLDDEEWQAAIEAAAAEE